MKVDAQQNFSEDILMKSHKDFINHLIKYKLSGFDERKAKEHISSYINNDAKRILEIGTHHGFLAVMLAKLNKSVVLISNDNVTQESALLNAAYEGLYPKIEFEIGSYCEVNYPTDSFDSVVSVFGVQYIENVIPVIKEMIRLAKDEIIISNLNKYCYNLLKHLSNPLIDNNDYEYCEYSFIPYFLKNADYNVMTIEDRWQTIYVAHKKAKAS